MIHRDQDRIRQNINALESGTELYRRYVEILNGQEEELLRLSDELKAAQAAEAAERKVLGDFLANI